MEQGLERDEARQQAVIRRAFWRLMPLLFAGYMMTFLDRVNLSFAALTMNHDLGITPSEYGLAVSMFFIGYAGFSLPSGLVAPKLGARVWISLLMVAWGAASVATAFVTGPTSLYVVRLLVGMAEAGYMPTAVMLFASWFPAAQRGRATATFMMGFPTAAIIGSPLSGWLLNVEIGGLHGWQSLLIIEGLPAVVLGVIAWFTLANRPTEARWLPADEAAWLERHVQAERVQEERTQAMTVRSMLTDVRLMLLASINLLFATCSYAIVFWLPQIIKDLGLGNVEVGLVNAIPFVLGMVLMIWLARRSDRTGERFWHSAAPVLVGAAGLIVSATGSTALMQATGLILSYAVLIAFTGTFFVLPGTFLSGRVVAAGVGFIILVGNIGGIVGPYVTGRLKEASEGLSLTLVVLASILTAAAALLLLLKRLAGGRAAAALTPAQ